MLSYCSSPWTLSENIDIVSGIKAIIKNKLKTQRGKKKHFWCPSAASSSTLVIWETSVPEGKCQWLNPTAGCRITLGKMHTGYYICGLHTTCLAVHLSCGQRCNKFCSSNVAAFTPKHFHLHTIDFMSIQIFWGGDVSWPIYLRFFSPWRANASVFFPRSVLVFMISLL